MAQPSYTKDRLPVIKAVKPLASRYGDEYAPETTVSLPEDSRPPLSFRDPCWRSLKIALPRAMEWMDSDDPVAATIELDWELRGDNIRARLQQDTVYGPVQELAPLGYWSEHRLVYSPRRGPIIELRSRPRVVISGTKVSLYIRDVNMVFPLCEECEEQIASPAAAAASSPKGEQVPVTHEELVAYFDKNRGPEANRREVDYAAARDHFRNRPPLTIKQIDAAREDAGVKGKPGAKRGPRK